MSVEDFLFELFAPLAGTHVDTYVWCCGATHGLNLARSGGERRALWMEHHRTAEGKFLNVHNWRSWCNLQSFLQAGHNPPELIARGARDCGMEMFFSLRMNDAHDAHDPDPEAVAAGSRGHQPHQGRAPRLADRRARRRLRAQVDPVVDAPGVRLRGGRLPGLRGRNRGRDPELRQRRGRARLHEPSVPVQARPGRAGRAAAHRHDPPGEGAGGRAGQVAHGARAGVDRALRADRHRRADLDPRGDRGRAVARPQRDPGHHSHRRVDAGGGGHGVPGVPVDQSQSRSPARARRGAARLRHAAPAATARTASTCSTSSGNRSPSTTGSSSTWTGLAGTRCGRWATSTRWPIATSCTSSTS